MLATGIENSASTIDHGQVRVDELEKCGHYRHWRTDFHLASDLGIRFLRFGPPLYSTFSGPAQYDWALADNAFSELRAIDMVPIADLCHFGVPYWLAISRIRTSRRILPNTQVPSPAAIHQYSFRRRSTRCTYAPGIPPCMDGGKSNARMIVPSSRGSSHRQGQRPGHAANHQGQAGRHWTGRVSECAPLYFP